jgi:hypothetical protein
MTYLEHLDFTLVVAAEQDQEQAVLAGQVLAVEDLATVQLAVVQDLVEVHQAGTQFIMAQVAVVAGIMAAAVVALDIKVLLFYAIKRNYVR